MNIRLVFNLLSMFKMYAFNCILFMNEKSFEILILNIIVIENM